MESVSQGASINFVFISDPVPEDGITYTELPLK